MNEGLFRGSVSNLSTLLPPAVHSTMSTLVNKNNEITRIAFTEPYSYAASRKPAKTLYQKWTQARESVEKDGSIIVLPSTHASSETSRDPILPCDYNQKQGRHLPVWLIVQVLRLMKDEDLSGPYHANGTCGTPNVFHNFFVVARLDESDQATAPRARSSILCIVVPGQRMVNAWSPFPKIESLTHRSPAR